jgi:hypothetical protein
MRRVLVLLVLPLLIAGCQECRAGEPLKESLVHVVPCGGSHRSEAVPGGAGAGQGDRPAERPERPSGGPGISHCEQKVIAYLGGRRPGLTSTAILPLPRDWPTGDTTAACWAIADHDVTAPLGHA